MNCRFSLFNITLVGRGRGAGLVSGRIGRVGRGAGDDEDAGGGGREEVAKVLEVLGHAPPAVLQVARGQGLAVSNPLGKMQLQAQHF